MADEVKACRSCGMHMSKAEDHGGGNVSNPYCVHCTDETGKLKGRTEIREGMINLYMSRMGKPRDEAEKFVDEQMRKLPAWKDSQDAEGSPRPPSCSTNVEHQALSSMIRPNLLGVSSFS